MGPVFQVIGVVEMRDKLLPLRWVEFGKLKKIGHLVAPEGAFIGAANGPQMMGGAKDFSQPEQPVIHVACTGG